MATLVVRGEDVAGRIVPVVRLVLGLDARDLAGSEPVSPVQRKAIAKRIYVISKNIHRRHLTASQRGIIVKRHLLPLLEEEAAKRVGGRPKKGEEKPTAELPEVSGEAAEQAAKAAGIGSRTVSDAKAVDEADPALGDEVLSGTNRRGRLPACAGANRWSGEGSLRVALRAASTSATARPGRREESDRPGRLGTRDADREEDRAAPYRRAGRRRPP